MSGIQGRYREATRERFYRILKYLIKTIDENKQVVYLMGSTFKGIKEVNNLNKKFDIKIVKTKSLRTGWLRVLPIPVAITFLIKLNNKEELPEVVRCLESHSPIEVFVFDKSLEESFLRKFNLFDRVYTRNLLSEDPEYLIYGMDFDNNESTTGSLEFIAYGDKLDNNMRWYFNS